MLGQIYLKQNRLDKAEESFAKASELSPNEGNYHFNLGFVRFGQDKFELAAADFVKAVELKNDDMAQACSLCGRALQKSGNPMEAFRYYNTSVQLQPDNAEYQMHRAMAFEGAWHATISGGKCFGVCPEGIRRSAAARRWIQPRRGFDMAWPWRDLTSIRMPSTNSNFY